ncbi:hypothetical protein HDK64DRAFT_342281 [Phyllosticta capitalensis]
MTGESQRRHEADLEHLRTCNADLRKQIEALRKDNQAAASKLSEKTRQLASVNTKLADLVPDIREAAIAVENDKKASLSAQRAVKRLRDFLGKYNSN